MAPGRDDRRGTPPRGSGKPSGRPSRSGPPQSRGESPRGRRTGSDAFYAKRDRGTSTPRTEDQQKYDGPDLPDDVSADDLDPRIRRSLSSLPDRLADRVARHLVAAGSLMATDPDLAHQHALAARSRAQRLAVIREAVGETAYAKGSFAEALSELRAAKRMNGEWHYTPMMADCERALKRPERAIALDTDSVREHLDDAGKVELAIVVAGARADQQQLEASARRLERESLHSPSREDWVPRLRYAYADALLRLGRRDDAIEWFHRTVAVDGNEQTDARERLVELGASTDV